VEGDDEPVWAPARRGLVVVSGDEAVDGLGQLGGERGPVLGRGEPHLGVDPERGQRLARRAGPGDELADLVDEAAGEGEQPARGALVGPARRVRRDRREGGRRDHVGGGRRLEHALGDVALAALLDELRQTVALERPEVVVRLLAGQADARRQRARGPGLGQLGKQAGPDRVQRGLGGGGVLDDGDVVHGRRVPPTN
jgi:hypothetical protein